MNAIVTGTSKGIGKEIIKIFQKKGINVIAISRHMYMSKEFPEGAKVKPGEGKVIPLSIDLTNTSIMKDKLQKLVKEEFNGVIDLLINNAGLLINKPFEHYISNEIQDILQVNFTGPAQLIAMSLEYLKQAKLPHVVNIASMGGFTGSVKFPGLSYYSASKAAIASLTEQLAEEFKDEGIKFNCLALGSVNTEMLQNAFPGYEASLSAEDMAGYIADFAINGHKYYNGKVLPVSVTTP